MSNLVAHTGRPNGDAIVYVERSEEHFSSSIRVLGFDNASGQPKSAPRTLYTSPVDRGGGWSIRDVEWSPDGAQLAAILQNSGWDRIYLLPAAGGTPKQLTDGAFVDQTPRSLLMAEYRLHFQPRGHSRDH